METYLTTTSNNSANSNPVGILTGWVTTYQSSYLHMVAGITIVVRVTCIARTRYLPWHPISVRVGYDPAHGAHGHCIRNKEVDGWHTYRSTQVCKIYFGPSPCAEEFHNRGTIQCFQVSLDKYSLSALDHRNRAMTIKRLMRTGRMGRHLLYSEVRLKCNDVEEVLDNHCPSPQCQTVTRSHEKIYWI